MCIRDSIKTALFVIFYFTQLLSSLQPSYLILSYIPSIVSSLERTHSFISLHFTLQNLLKLSRFVRSYYVSCRMQFSKWHKDRFPLMYKHLNIFCYFPLPIFLYCLFVFNWVFSSQTSFFVLIISELRSDVTKVSFLQRKTWQTTA